LKHKFDDDLVSENVQSGNIGFIVAADSGNLILSFQTH